MNFRRLSLALVILLLAAAPVRAAERVERWSAPAGAGGLRVSAFRGPVTVEPAEDDILRIEARATGPEAARLEAIRMSWTQVGDSWILEVSDPAETGVRFAWQEKGPVPVDLRIRMPRLRTLQIAVADGPVRLGRIVADVEVISRRGLVTCAFIEGNVTVRAGEGNVILSRATGDADLRCELGNVAAGTVGGHARLFARNGDVELMSARGGLDLKSDGGNAPAWIAPGLEKAARVESAGGNVTLRVDPSARISLHVTSTWGRIRERLAPQLRLPLTLLAGAFDSRRLQALINGGGTDVKAHASGGNVEIMADEVPF